MVISFNYHRMPNKKGTDVRTPTIPVVLGGNSSFPMKVLALIDSGADVSIIPKDLAEVLNLDLSKKTHVSFGICGKMKVKNSRMRIVVEKNREKYVFVIPVQVILDYDVPIILGRQGFFDKFVITIDEKNKKVKLKKKTELF